MSAMAHGFCFQQIDDQNHKKTTLNTPSTSPNIVDLSIYKKYLFFLPHTTI